MCNVVIYYRVIYIVIGTLYDSSLYRARRDRWRAWNRINNVRGADPWRMGGPESSRMPRCRARAGLPPAPRAVRVSAIGQVWHRGSGTEIVDSTESRARGVPYVA
jgi:hypothetical protein